MSPGISKGPIDVDLLGIGSKSYFSDGTACKLSRFTMMDVVSK